MTFAERCGHGFLRPFQPSRLNGAPSSGAPGFSPHRCGRLVLAKSGRVSGSAYPTRFTIVATTRRRRSSRPPTRLVLLCFRTPMTSDPPCGDTRSSLPMISGGGIKNKLLKARRWAADSLHTARLHDLRSSARCRSRKRQPRPTDRSDGRAVGEPVARTELTRHVPAADTTVEHSCQECADGIRGRSSAPERPVRSRVGAWLTIARAAAWNTQPTIPHHWLAARRDCARASPACGWPAFKTRVSTFVEGPPHATSGNR